MSTSGATFADSDLSSFSSLLGRLSRGGIADSPETARSLESAQAVVERVDELGYSPWPLAAQPWHAINVGVDTPKARQGGERSRRVKRSNFPQQTDQPIPCGRGDSQFDESSGRIAESDWSEPETGNAFRRSVVSIRLNEDEMKLLRQRATESGISVSKYVRSCVVEAEQLRVQVKQAVAEMRSQPTAGLAPRGQKVREMVPDSSHERRRTQSFWLRWGAILLGPRERESIHLRSPASGSLSS